MCVFSCFKKPFQNDALEKEVITSSETRGDVIENIVDGACQVISVDKEFEDSKLLELDNATLTMQMKNAGDAISDALGGVSFQLKLTCPIEAALRWFANKALQRIENTDVGEYFKNICTSELTQVLEGVAMLTHVNFKFSKHLLNLLIENFPSISNQFGWLWTLTLRPF